MLVYPIGIPIIVIYIYVYIYIYIHIIYIYTYIYIYMINYICRGHPHPSEKQHHFIPSSSEGHPTPQDPGPSPRIANSRPQRHGGKTMVNWVSCAASKTWKTRSSVHSRNISNEILGHPKKNSVDMQEKYKLIQRGSITKFCDPNM